jgi:hypothetical protein
MTVARRPLTQLGYISEAVSPFSSVPGVTVKKAVFRKQLYERVFKEQSYESVLRGVLRVSLKDVNSRSKISARVLRRRYRSRLAVGIEDFACATVCDNL